MFSHKMSKKCDEADIDYRKQYTAPAGALTMFFPIENAARCLDRQVDSARGL
jgi:hypothetical protein